jgi:hypothetical protein
MTGPGRVKGRLEAMVVRDIGLVEPSKPRTRARVPAFVRRMIVAVFGGTVLLIGLVLVVFPGPAVVVIPLGLAILATELVWARRWLQKAGAVFKHAKAKIAN